MNLKLYIICTAAVLSLMGPLMCPAFADGIATIHGAVYKMDTYEPLDNAVIEVNSTPTQYMVAKNGEYSIKLTPGNYTITARYYENDVLTYAAVGIIPVKTGGDYVYDLLLPPVNNENLKESTKKSTTDISIDKINISNGVSFTNRSLESANKIQKTADAPFSSNLINNLQILATKQNGLYSSFEYVLIGFVSCFLLLGIFLLLRNNKQIEDKYFKKVSPKTIGSDVEQGLQGNNEEDVSITEVKSKIQERNVPGSENHPARKTELAEPVSEEDKTRVFLEELERNLEIENPPLKKKLLLPADLQEVLNVIKSQGGMISQKDLRSMLNYSEVKVSVMLTDLEKMKRVKKFKRGRENFVVLIDWKQ